jgi:hypothetical protein
MPETYAARRAKPDHGPQAPNCIDLDQAVLHIADSAPAEKQAALSAVRNISPFIVIHGRSRWVTSYQPGLINSTFYQL